MERPWNPISTGRRGLLTICALAMCVDAALRLMFFVPIWSALESVGMLPATIASMLGGLVTLLLPVAFVMRSPDAWRVRRALFVGTLLAAGSELAYSASTSVTGLNTWQLGSGTNSIWVQVLPFAHDLNLLGEFAGVVGTLLFALGLARIRERSASQSSRRLVALVLVGIGILGLANLRPFVSPPFVIQVTDWSWTRPAVLAAGVLASLCLAWVIITGWSAGEAPRRPWRVAAVATCIGFATLALASLPNLGVAGLDGRFYFFVTGLGVVGGIFFVAAIADGLGASLARE